MLSMPAIPTTTVQKMSGAIVILTSLMKPSASGLSSTATSGATKPITTPIAIATSTRKYSDFTNGCATLRGYSEIFSESFPRPIISRRVAFDVFHCRQGLMVGHIGRLNCHDRDRLWTSGGGLASALHHQLPRLPRPAEPRASAVGD